MSGAAFALPLLWFWLRNRIPAGYGWRLTALLALGGLQGAIGWWMVTSGLSVRTDVSHIRLAVHLVTALVILSGIDWTALDLRALHARPLARPARLRPRSEEHTYELPSLMRPSYAGFCLKKKKQEARTTDAIDRRRHARSRTRKRNTKRK